MSQFSDSDLERVLADALASGREVPDDWREAARAAYAWRTVDQELLTLTHDSLLEAGAAVRGEEEPRVLEFSGAGLTLEVERDGGRLAGRLAPATPGEVTIELPTGDRHTVRADESGFFVVDGVADGLVRFTVVAGDRRLVTEWVSL
jgi:hypothetical protein